MIRLPECDDQLELMAYYTSLAVHSCYHSSEESAAFERSKMDAEKDVRKQSIVGGQGGVVGKRKSLMQQLAFEEEQREATPNVCQFLF